VLLDTRLLPTDERADAVDAALNSATSPTRLTAHGDLRAVVEAWGLGGGANLIAHESSGYRLTRAEGHVRRSAPEVLSLALNIRGSCWSSSRGLEHTRNDQLHPIDLTSVYDSETSGSCTTLAFQVDYARLRTRVDTVRAAIPHLAASPLHDLVFRHLRDLPAAARQLDSPAAIEALGSATTELVRALVCSVVADDRRRRSALAESLPTLIEAYVDQHLGDQDLTPASVASAHNISLRYLYLLLADRAETPAAWIMAKRLEAARAHLALATDSVATTAYRYGFKEPTHFSRRFKALYGLTPGQWAQQNRIAARPASPSTGGR
jgi:AraC-like DNA-binding protein